MRRHRQGDVSAPVLPPDLRGVDPHVVDLLLEGICRWDPDFDNLEAMIGPLADTFPGLWCRHREALLREAARRGLERVWAEERYDRPARRSEDDPGT